MDKITNVNNFGWDPRLGINGLGVYILSMVDMALWDILCKKWICHYIRFSVQNLI